jgi:serine/threonine-protein kinase
MPQFPELPVKEYAQVYKEDTDKALPEKLDPNLRYAFFSTIAKGGKSLIKSCKDMHLGRFVCYKTLKPEFVDDPIEQQRLLREARVSAMLQHPSTIPTYEIGRDKRGNYYFTMKLVHGYTLREILDYRERYDLTQLLDVVIDVGHALEYAHSHGVLHRDIKPENILVGPFGEVILMDWGLAKVWDTKGTQEQLPESASAPETDDVGITGQAKLQGTVSYMSPEQINRDPAIDGRTDVYSLAAIIYEILAGRTAAQGETMDQLVRSTLEEIPETPSTLVRYPIPELLEKVTMQCLKKDPAERVQTMGEMIRLLQETRRQG